MDKIISPEDYQKKKNELVETKSLLNSKIKEISQNGVEWLEPFQEFINSALSAEAGAESATSRPLSNSYWLALVDDFRTANWHEIIPYPELVYQKSQQYLQYYASN